MSAVGQEVEKNVDRGAWPSECIKIKAYLRSFLHGFQIFGRIHCENVRFGICVKLCFLSAGDSVKSTQVATFFLSPPRCRCCLGPLGGLRYHQRL